MTEEIIVNGINVAGCNFRLERDNKQKCECCHATGFGVICDCEAWHNCYYKQLKRKEAECEELKRYEYTYLDKFLDLKQAIEEIRQFCGCYSENDIAKPIFEVILNIIDGDSEPIPDDEIPF